MLKKFVTLKNDQVIKSWDGKYVLSRVSADMWVKIRSWDLFFLQSSNQSPLLPQILKSSFPRSSLCPIFAGCNIHTTFHFFPGKPIQFSVKINQLLPFSFISNFSENEDDPQAGTTSRTNLLHNDANNSDSDSLSLPSPEKKEKQVWERRHRKIRRHKHKSNEERGIGGFRRRWGPHSVWLIGSRRGSDWEV